jgi:hypothetical protein
MTPKTTPTRGAPLRQADDRPSRTARENQADFVAKLRAESCTDGSVPLGSYPAPAPLPESGPSAFAYFRAKHQRGEYGRFYPVHGLVAWSAKQFLGKEHR